MFDIFIFIHHHLQSFAIHCLMEDSPTRFNSFLFWATIIHLILHVILTSSTLPYTLLNFLGNVYSSIVIIIFLFSSLRSIVILLNHVYRFLYYYYFILSDKKVFQTVFSTRKGWRFYIFTSLFVKTAVIPLYYRNKLWMLH